MHDLIGAEPLLCWDLLLFYYKLSGRAQQMLCLDKGFFGTPDDEVLTLPKY